ncbi:hypothetical protein Phi12:1_gp51 [Cellulophaga phage phi12:1]|uniref:Uncharacterized protein n=2 Tax=Cellulophaga phage phi12:1 TaxID=1327976 RepID=S0A0I6_9CAUD|nr:hypothetical protein Phi12:1_gp51 [Cellulophaga phage phi12:1]AGO48017.1 hypothetical protein Phi12:1_gp51 [Cellulophaga phage phi12:1]AGO48182.1 hypothetical protein Phi12:3_gp51 [Cellulophaga phage phi12:3]
MELKTVSDLRDDFDGNTSEDAYQLSLSNTNDDDDNYYLDFTTYTNMYEATGEESYLDFAVQLFENKVSQSSLMVDGYYGWVRDADNSDGGITNGGGGTDGEEISLSQTRGFGRTAARMFWILNRATGYLAKNDNQTQFNTNYQWFKTNICEKWRSRGFNHIYRIRTHMMSHWAQIGYFMNEIEPNAIYRKWYDDFNTDISDGNYVGSMREQLRTVSLTGGDGYIWSGEWGNTTNTNDVNHANAEVELMVIGAEYNDYWTLSDIDKIKRTFDQNIFVSATDGAEYIDGTTETDSRQVWTQGWIKLGRFDAALQERLQTRREDTDATFFYYKRGISEMAYNKAYLDGVIYPLEVTEPEPSTSTRNQKLIYWR